MHVQGFDGIFFLVNDYYIVYDNHAQIVLQHADNNMILLYLLQTN